jgi:hypothetical protein
MIRLLTAAFVVVLVACGSSGGGGANPALQSLFPSEDPAVGTIYAYDVTKTLTRTVVVGTKFKQFDFEIDRVVDPVDPDLTYVGEPGFPEGGCGFMWTSRGLELTAVFETTFWGVDGVCVTLTSPGLLLLPADLGPGETHTCNLVGAPLSSIATTWVGPEAVPGHPDAQRFDFDSTGPYSNGDPGNARFGATEVRILGTLYLVPGVGPVSGVVRQQFRLGATVLEERRYDFELTGVTPGP